MRIYKFNFETALSFWRCRFILSHNVRAAWRMCRLFKTKLSILAVTAALRQAACYLPLKSIKMNDFLIFKRKIRKMRKADIKAISPIVSNLKQRGFNSSGWFDFPTAGRSRHWKKIGEHVFLEVRDIDKAKILEIPEVCLSINGL